MEWKRRLICFTLTPFSTFLAQTWHFGYGGLLLVALSPARCLLPLCLCPLPSAWRVGQRAGKSLAKRFILYLRSLGLENSFKLLFLGDSVQF